MVHSWTHVGPQIPQVSLGWLCTACEVETLRRNYALSTLYYFSEANKELMETFYV